MASRSSVRTFPDMGGPWQVGPGSAPQWSPDGTRLYYLDGNDLMQVEVAAGAEIRFEAPSRLFTFEIAPVYPDTWPVFDLTPDGGRFVMVRTAERPPGMVTWLIRLATSFLLATTSSWLI